MTSNILTSCHYLTVVFEEQTEVYPKMFNFSPGIQDKNLSFDACFFDQYFCLTMAKLLIVLALIFGVTWAKAQTRTDLLRNLDPILSLALDTMKTATLGQLLHYYIRRGQNF